MKGAFSIKSKKTPYQRHKELEEEKKRKADEEAAKVYEEFVESFQGDDRAGSGRDGGSGGVKAFVRGGVVAPGSRSTDATGIKGSKYVPAGAAAVAAANKPVLGRVQQRHNAFADDDEDEAEEESVFKLPTKKPTDKDKPRQIDRMLEQLKKEQEDREERERLLKEGKPLPPELMRPEDFERGGHGDRGDRDGGGSGHGGGHGGDGRGGGGRGYSHSSIDDSDPYTTNLYVGNIHPEVNEAHLAREFGRFGPIGSVKIMWPRDEEQRRRGRNCGFVAFMQRGDAEAARKALDGLVLHGMEMRVGWGKAVPLPPVPLYSGTGVPTGPLTAIVPPAVTRERGNPLTLALQSALVPAQGMYAKESTMSREVIKGTGAPIEVKVPEDPKQRFLIDSLALYVLKDGCEFEQLVMMEQQGRPEYAFLFDLGSSEHVYYRWRLYSLAEGDTLRTWRIDPFIMVEGGQAWVPPAMLAADIAAGEKRAEIITAQRGQQAVLLSDYDRDRLEDMLRGLTAERAAIAEAMVFALENADAAGDVVEVLEEALTLPETAPATKLARLYLVNDILANATAPVRNASRYRAKLEACLPEVFVSFQATQAAADSRMVQEALRRAVLRLLRVWRDRFIFNDDYINGLQATFLGHIPILEAAEEEEIKQQQEAAAAAAKAAEAAAAAAAAGGAAGANSTAADGAADDSAAAAAAAPAAKSRWEVMEGDEEEEAGKTAAAAAAKREQQEREAQAERERQQQREQQQREQHARGSAHPPVPQRVQLRYIHPPLVSELEALTAEELERRCRVNGLSNRGSKALCIERLLALDYYLHADERGPLPSLEIIAAATAGAAARGGGDVDGVDGVGGGGGGRAIVGDASGWGPAEDAGVGIAAGAAADGIGVGRQGSGSGRWSTGVTLSIPLCDSAAAAAAAAAVKQEQPDSAAVNGLHQQQQQPAGAQRTAAAAASSGWQTVDEEAEREGQPQVPISKWLQEEADAEEQRQAAETKAQQEAAAAAAAAAAKEAAARAAIAGAAGGGAGAGAAGGGGAGDAAAKAADAALEEERRKRLRQIEVQVLDHQEDLQDKGAPAAEAEAAAAALRQQLVAQLDAELQQQQQQQAAAAAKAAAGSSRSLQREGSKDRDRDRDKHKDKEKEKESSRGRSSSHRKRSRSRSRSSSRSRSRGRGRSSSSKHGEAGGGLRRASSSGKGSKADREDKDRDRDSKRSSKDKDRDRDRDRDRDSKRSRRRSSRSRSSSRGGERRRSRSPSGRSGGGGGSSSSKRHKG